MEERICPICSGKLVDRDVAPCYDCGHGEDELGELKSGEHEYFVYRIFGWELLLCDFCDADFGSYYSDYFCLKGEFPMGQDYGLERVARVEAPSASRDKYYEACQHRLAFLEFLKKAREYNNR